MHPEAGQNAGKPEGITGDTKVQRELMERTLPVLDRATEIETEDLPLRVVPDWDEQVKRASELCKLIDRHLDYEARGRLLLDLADFRPQHLCPEQRVQMVSDLYAVTR